MAGSAGPGVSVYRGRLKYERWQARGRAGRSARLGARALEASLEAPLAQPPWAVEPRGPVAEPEGPRRRKLRSTARWTSNARSVADVAAA